MNSKQAKTIKIKSFLFAQGIKPEYAQKNNLWYCSPFRKEKTPSFKLNTQNNIWYDHGLGIGGNILDLICKMYNVKISGALKLLSTTNIVPVSFSFQQQKTTPKTIKIKHVQELQNKALIQYLNKRCISFELAKKYVQEAYYKVNGKQYFALAFKNYKGGYELRNQYYKGSSSPKAITIIKGVNNSLNIFEGFIDFLSALEYYKTYKPKGTTIILNSLANMPQAEKFISDFSKTYLYLDNDSAGTSIKENIIMKLHNNVYDKSMIYKNYKDFNEFLTNKI